MRNFLTKLATCALIVQGVFGFASAIAIPLDVDNKTPLKSIDVNMFHVGTTDGKSYYALDTPERNWDSANDYCKNQGMRLASVESSAQWQLILSKSHTAGFSWEYWTAGVDVGGNRQMKWITSGAITTPAFVPIASSHNGNQFQCLTYNAMHKGFRIQPCSVTVGVLCEKAS